MSTSPSDIQHEADDDVTNKSPPPQQPRKPPPQQPPPSLQETETSQSSGIQGINDEQVIDATGVGTTPIGQQAINAPERMHEQDASQASIPQQLLQAGTQQAPKQPLTAGPPKTAPWMPALNLTGPPGKSPAAATWTSPVPIQPKSPTGLSTASSLGSFMPIRTSVSLSVPHDTEFDGQLGGTPRNPGVTLPSLSTEEMV